MKRVMRREFLKSSVGFLGVMGALEPALLSAPGGCQRFIACQQYPWFQQGVMESVHLVLEQAVEAGTPLTLKAVDAHRRGREYAERLFLRA